MNNRFIKKWALRRGELRITESENIGARLAPTSTVKTTKFGTTKKGSHCCKPLFLLVWCQWSDSNRHALWAPDFESGASTNSATLASGAHFNDLRLCVKH